MNVFEVSFFFENHVYVATVSMSRKQDHLQYTVTPQDEDILARYPVQVLHEFPGKTLEPASPPRTDEQKEYAEAVLAGLKRFLDRLQKREV